MDQEQAKALWQLEERFWLGSADFYSATLAPNALMVLPQPAGVLDRVSTVASIRSGNRWRKVSFQQQHLVSVSPETAVLVYLAHAERDAPGASYVAQCSSTYVRDRGQWLLAVHHQALAGQASGRSA